MGISTEPIGAVPSYWIQMVMGVLGKHIRENVNTVRRKLIMQYAEKDEKGEAIVKYPMKVDINGNEVEDKTTGTVVFPSPEDEEACTKAINELMSQEVEIPYTIKLDYLADADKYLPTEKRFTPALIFALGALVSLE
jgi:hypothetical protein